MKNTELQTESLSLRLTPTTRKKLQYIADQEYRSLNAQLRKVVEDFIENYEKEYNLLEKKDYIGSPSYDESLDINK